jgi:hypothetical protein
VNLDAQLGGGSGYGRGSELASTPSRAIGGCGDEHRSVGRVGQAAQDRDGELGGPQIDRPHTSSSDGGL